MRVGARLKMNATTGGEVSFAVKANVNKIKNAIPMYALTLHKRQIPMPINTQSRILNRISSLRSLHLSNFRKIAFKATEKQAESRKMKQAIATFCTIIGKEKLRKMGSRYALNGESPTKSPKLSESANNGTRLLFWKLEAGNRFCIQKAKNSNAACPIEIIIRVISGNNR